MKFDVARAEFERLRARHDAGEDVSDAVGTLREELRAVSIEPVEGPPAALAAKADRIREHTRLGPMDFGADGDPELVDMARAWESSCLTPGLIDEIEQALASYVSEAESAESRVEELTSTRKALERQNALLEAYLRLLDRLAACGG